MPVCPCGVTPAEWRPRGEEGEYSDIDLLVDFAPGSSLFDLLRLNRELEGLLRHPVDVVSSGGL